MGSYWFVVVVSLCFCAVLKTFFSLLFSKKKGKLSLPYPPGPFTFPVIGRLLWLNKPLFEIESIIRDAKNRFGPIISLKITSRPSIFVGSHSLAHRALVQNGAVFSDRPKALPTAKIFNSNQRNISSAAYGPTWRLLRRNLTVEILHPSRVKSYSRARQWVLGILVDRLGNHSGDAPVIEDFRFAVFSLLVLMCVGDKVGEDKIKEIESVMRKALSTFGRFNILNLLPLGLSKILLQKQWKNLIQLRKDQENVLLPLIRARAEGKRGGDGDEEEVVAYVDTLAGLRLPEEKRELNEDEIMTLCSEFLNAGTDTTATSLQWIMANLVKYPDIQKRLYEDIVAVAGAPPPAAVGVDVKEEDLQRIPYLKAVVLEGLRRHPPGHFVLPHAVTEEAVLGEYTVPKKAVVNFMVADMGWDPAVWENPMEFRPERFVTGGGDVEFDVTGNKEIKMMPFGAGRRICPGFGLALLHLEYFVANLIWLFEWKPVDGDEVDLSEKQEFTVVMKNPLRASISPRV